jgi:hypothetical protein
MGLFFVVYLTSSRLNLGSHEASSWGATSPHVYGMAVPRNRKGSRRRRTGSDKGWGKGSARGGRAATKAWEMHQVTANLIMHSSVPQESRKRQ